MAANNTAIRICSELRCVHKNRAGRERGIDNTPPKLDAFDFCEEMGAQV